MRDPFTWAVPLGRIFGITVRVHILFFIFVLVMWLKATSGKAGGIDGAGMLTLMGLLFVSVLLHELGHCFAARRVDGEATEVLLWPLGGLAKCDVPHAPWAHFVTAAGGPLVNVLLCLLSSAMLIACSLRPTLNPFEPPGVTQLFGDSGMTVLAWQNWIAQFFWLNWAMLLINVVLIGFPLDGGRMLQATLWPRLGYRSATRAAIVIGFIVMFIIGAYALLQEQLMILCLAGFIYVACKQEWINLDMGGEESLFGYDFSQGYTSLERDQPATPRKKRPNFLQAWLQRRAAKKLQRQQEQQEADERRMDELLEKIAREGKQSLTDEEQRFLKRVSDRYRNRH